MFHAADDEAIQYIPWNILTALLKFDFAYIDSSYRFIKRFIYILPWQCWGGWGCEVSCGGHHRLRGKTTTGSALDGAVFDIAQILACLVHNMSRSQLYLGLAILADSLLFAVNNILTGLWLNCITSVEITLFWLTYYCSIGFCFSVRV